MILNHSLSLTKTGKHAILLFILVGLFFSQALHAQRSCGTNSYMQDMIKANPNIQYRMQMVEDQIQENVKSAVARVKGDIVIPVVVHVVWNQPDQNISDAQIKSQLQVLNQDFQRKNPDKIQTPAIFQSVAASSDIRFQLAQRDPQGRPTSGITRKRQRKPPFIRLTMM